MVIMMVMKTMDGGDDNMIGIIITLLFLKS